MEIIGTVTGEEVVEVWTGAAHSGISMDSLEEATIFFQGFLTSLLCFPSNRSAEKLLKVLEKMSDASYHERALLLHAVRTGLDANLRSEVFRF